MLENSSSKKIYGIVAEFEDPKSLLESAEKVKSLKYEKFDCHSPFPIHGLDEAMGLKDSSLGWIVIFFAFCGLFGGLALMGWTSTIGYPIIVSGKPLFAFEPFVPIMFELTILFSAFSTVFGMLGLNKLPLFYHPIFKHSTFYKASSDGFFISIESGDPQFEIEKTKDFLASLGGRNIEIVYND